jgi:hypothetical protein
LLEPVNAGAVAGEAFGDQLDRHLATEAGVSRTIDLAHATGTDPVDDLEPADSTAARQGHQAGVFRTRSDGRIGRGERPRHVDGEGEGADADDVAIR